MHIDLPWPAGTLIRPDLKVGAAQNTYFSLKFELSATFVISPL
jgi:hypothetical protein